MKITRGKIWKQEKIGRKDLLRLQIIFETGIRKVTSNELSDRILGIYFNPKWNQGYDNTFSGLEIADLTSYPIHKYIRNNKKDKAFLALENKIDKYPDYINKGIKVFP